MLSLCFTLLYFSLLLLSSITGRPIKSALPLPLFPFLSSMVSHLQPYPPQTVHSQGIPQSYVHTQPFIRIMSPSPTTHLHPQHHNNHRIKNHHRQSLFMHFTHKHKQLHTLKHTQSIVLHNDSHFRVIISSVALSVAAHTRVCIPSITAMIICQGCTSTSHLFLLPYLYTPHNTLHSWPY